MPNCFTLTKKGEDKPSPFQAIDEAICAYLEVDCDPVHWYAGWYDTIGLGYAMGWSAEKMRGIFTDERLHRVLDFLEAEYTVNAWAEVGRWR